VTAWEYVVDAPIQSSPEKRLPAALLAYAVALAGFLLVPPFLKASVLPPEGFTLQETADLLTPLVATPLAWVVFDLAGGLGRRGLVAFLLVSALWVEGQGIHLAANAIGDAFPKGGAEAFYATVPGNLDYWLDEILSHWMWHMGWVALSGLVLAAAIRADVRTPDRTSRLAASAGLVHGVAFFFVTVEGLTTALGIPASIVLVGCSTWAARRGLARHPVITFLLMGSIVTLLGYLGWGALHGWTLPEFTKVGLFN
jgi:hypothetical protein